MVLLRMFDIEEDRLFFWEAGGTERRKGKRVPLFKKTEPDSSSDAAMFSHSDSLMENTHTHTHIGLRISHCAHNRALTC